MSKSANKIKLQTSKSKQVILASVLIFLLFIFFLRSSAPLPPPSLSDLSEVDLVAEELSDDYSSKKELVLPSSPSPTSSLITIVTGTHFSAAAMDVDERKQDPKCLELANAIHLMWSAWEVNPYATYKERVRELLKSIANQHLQCVLAGSRKYALLWTFPMAWRPDMEWWDPLESTCRHASLSIL